jgi:hypothetical protein
MGKPELTIVALWAEGVDNVEILILASRETDEVPAQSLW